MAAGAGRNRQTMPSAGPPAPRDGSPAALPRVIVTGASGFLGRHLLAGLKDRYRVFALARRSQRTGHAPVHHNISWHQVDVGDREELGAVFGAIRETGGADFLVHLAAYYDFTGQEHPEYRRTNVEGLRNVLEESKGLGLRRFVFASSVAACRFPPPGRAVNELSPPDADHVYARSKRIGEELVREYGAHFPASVVRLGALFSDWCEYPPLFMFLSTWLSREWNRRILAGQGNSGIAYLHVRDAVAFFQVLLERDDAPAGTETVIASTDDSVYHRRLFDEATRCFFGRKVDPVFMPWIFCWMGLWLFDRAGSLLGRRPFERPWMAGYIDRQLTVDASLTRKRIGWAPNPRLLITRRMPFLIDNRRADPVEWHRRNWAALKREKLSESLRLYQLMERHHEEMVAGALQRFLGLEALDRFPNYLQLSTEDLEWSLIQVYRHLRNAVRTRERALFRAYCHDLAKRRFRQGFACEEVCDALAAEKEYCRRTLQKDPGFHGLEDTYSHQVDMTFRLGIDEVQDVFEELSGRFSPPER